MSDTILNSDTSTTQVTTSTDTNTDQSKTVEAQPADTSAADQSKQADTTADPAKDDAAKAKDEKSADADDGDKGESEKDQTDKKDEATGAPEEYADFTLADGITLDEKSLGEFKTLAKEMNLTQDQAQKLVTLQNSMALAQAEAYQAQVEEWVSAAKNDKEYGGKEFEKNAALANKALTQFGSRELVSYLNDTKLGNHPEVVRAFYKIGKALEEGGVKRSSDSAGSSNKKGLLSIYND